MYTGLPDLTKGGLTMENVVEVDLENNSPRAQPILTSQVGPGGKMYVCIPDSLPKTWQEIIGVKIQASADSVSCKGNDA